MTLKMRVSAFEVEFDGLDGFLSEDEPKKRAAPKAKSTAKAKAEDESEEPKKRTRKTKPNKTKCKSMAASVASKCGADTQKELFEDFEIEKIDDLDPDDYGDFIDEAQKVLDDAE